MSVPRLDLLPDHVLDAERCLVGACAVWPEHLDREPMVDLLPEHFADARWRACWRELRRLREEHGAIDPAILVDAVVGSGQLRGAMTDAMVNAPDLRDAASHGLPEVHTRIIREAHTTRQV